jgi:ankyrin repeat protein
VNKKDKEGRTALHFAMMRCDVEIALDFLHKGADVSAQDYVGVTPLMRAAKYGNVGVVLALLQRGANANEKDVRGKAALQYAEERPRDDSEEETYQRAQIVRALKAAGAK